MTDLYDEIELDFDDILNSSPPTRIPKRQNSEPLEQEINKKIRNEATNSDEIIERQPDLHVGHEKSAKKVFHFKKNIANQSEIDTTTLQRERLTELKNKTVNNEEISNKQSDIQVLREKTSRKVFQSKINDEKQSETEKCSNNSSGVDKSPNSEKIEMKESNSRKKRKFPGPAGLLPDRNMETSPIKLEKTNRNEEIYSQTPNHNESIWSRIESDFAPKDNGIYLPDKYNIQWIKNNVVLLKRLSKNKSPFLIVSIQSIRSRNHSIRNPIVNLVLKDKTGTIHGTILHDLYKEFSCNLCVGSLLILKDVSVLTQNNEPYITITKNNLISIYTQATSDVVSKITNQEMSLDEITNKVEAIERLNQREIERTKETKRSWELRGKESNNCDKIQPILKKNDHVTSLISQQELEDFFRDEPVFSSTQIETNQHQRQLESRRIEDQRHQKQHILSKVETANPEVLNLFEDVNMDDFLDDF